MKSSDLKVATHADIVNIRYCVFCQPGGVPYTLAVCANWLNVHVGIMYTRGYLTPSPSRAGASYFRLVRPLCALNVPINVVPHLYPPEGGGDKGGDLTTFQSNPPPLELSS